LFLKTAVDRELISCLIMTDDVYLYPSGMWMFSRVTTSSGDPSEQGMHQLP